MDNFLSLIEEDKRIIEDRLDLVYKNQNEFEKMCAYSFSVGGKRIRAILLLESFKSYKEVSDLALDFAISLELIHNYSLVHDDLPEMDNDDYRWGKPTNHRVYGQDIAVLTGDSMLTLAFEVLSKSNINDTLKVNLIQQFANYSGAMGMIAGQVYDVKQKNYQVDANYLKLMHSLKTGRLIELPLDFACKIARKESDLDYIRSFGKELGIAYQIKDDILDYYGEFEKIGKLPSDEDMITYLSFYGIDECKELLEKHTTNAIEISRKLENNLLEDFANYLLKRDK